MKKVMLFLILGMMLIGLTGLVLAIPNPAPIYCKNMGYTFNETNCIFLDNKSCELWAFYNGKCGKDYVKELSCSKEGESLSPGYKCCEGLNSISPATSTSINKGICNFAVGSWSICSPCENGVCDKYENNCNCPKDCPSKPENDTQIIGGQRDEHGCLGPAGYSWNQSEEKCVREWEKGEMRYQNGENNGHNNSIEPRDNNENELNNKNKTNQGLGQEIRNRVRAGIYINENGDEIRVSEIANNRMRLKVKDIEVDCDENCNLSEEKIQNRTRLKMHLSNGDEREVKIMPDKASEKALEKLKLKFCNNSNNCSIQLKEVGKGKDIRAAYELQIERHKKLLGLFRIKAQEKTQIDSESGEVIMVKKPWWAFLATNSD